MELRIAIAEDVKGIQRVRHAVTENTLSDPALVPDTDVLDYILRRGRGWVATADNQIIGFSIVSVIDKNVWALFIDPTFEKKGIGRQLHDVMMDWYVDQTTDTCWLSTSPGTRAEGFYRKAGWIETGVYGKGEIRFEMSCSNWKQKK
jgi:GNAT superfamily N-acetyltransferase